MSRHRVTGLTRMRHFTERVWVVGCLIERSEIGLLSLRFAAFLETFEGELVICDVGAIWQPDGPTIEALARFQLTARRHGRRMRLHRARPAMIEMIDLCGLSAVLPLFVGLSLELHRQAEQREEALHVEKVVQPPDLAV